MFRLSTTSVRLKSSKPACFFINYKVNKENSVLTQIRTARKDSCVSGDKIQVRIIKNDGSIYQINKYVVDSSNDTSTFEESSENATADLKTANSFFYWGNFELIQQDTIRATATRANKNLP